MTDPYSNDKERTGLPRWVLSVVIAVVLVSAVVVVLVLTSGGGGHVPRPH